MLIDGVRIRWSVSRLPLEIVCTFSIGAACMRCSVPFNLTDGVGTRVTELIDVLVNSHVIDDSTRAVTIGNAQTEFLNWGYRWHGAS